MLDKSRNRTSDSTIIYDYLVRWSKWITRKSDPSEHLLISTPPDIFTRHPSLQWQGKSLIMGIA